MIDPSDIYQDTCLAGDTAAHVAALPDPELCALLRYITAQQKLNTRKGGVLAFVLIPCLMEASTRWCEAVGKC